MKSLSVYLLFVIFSFSPHILEAKEPEWGFDKERQSKTISNLKQVESSSQFLKRKIVELEEKIDELKSKIDDFQLLPSGQEEKSTPDLDYQNHMTDVLSKVEKLEKSVKEMMDLDVKMEALESQLISVMNQVQNFKTQESDIDLATIIDIQTRLKTLENANK